jgi:hypothetical protein
MRIARSLLALTALLVLSFVSVAEFWHDEVREHDCPVCHTAHLSVVKPASWALPEPPAVSERLLVKTEAAQGLSHTCAAHAPRAPPV